MDLLLGLLPDLYFLTCISMAAFQLFKPLLFFLVVFFHMSSDMSIFILDLLFCIQIDTVYYVVLLPAFWTCCQTLYLWSCPFSLITTFHTSHICNVFSLCRTLSFWGRASLLAFLSLVWQLTLAMFFSFSCTCFLTFSSFSGTFCFHLPAPLTISSSLWPSLTTFHPS